MERQNNYFLYSQKQFINQYWASNKKKEACFLKTQQLETTEEKRNLKTKKKYYYFFNQINNKFIKICNENNNHQ